MSVPGLSWTALAAGAGTACLVFWSVSPKFRFYSRVALYYCSLSAVAFVVMPIHILRPNKNVENMCVGARVFSAVSKNLLGFNYRLSASPSVSIERAIELLSASVSGGAVVVVNHQHAIDVIGLFEIWPMMERCSAVAKRSLLYTGSFGLFAWLAGTTFIDRSRGKQAVDSLVTAAHWANATRTKLLVFPEGTRNHSAGTMLPFKRGAFVAAVAAGLPILPVVFSHYDFLDSSGAAPKLERGNVRISVLEPIPTKGLTEADADKLAVDTRLKMLEEFSRCERQ